MKIGIDIDNVISTTTISVINYINERLPDIKLQIENISTYWIEDAIPEGYKWIVDQSFHDSKMWKEVQLVNDCAIVIEKLFNKKNEIYFVTATSGDNVKKKINFLNRNFPFFPKGYIEKHFISIKEKQLLNIDFLVDDYLENLNGERLYKSICFDYPWNRITNYEDGKTFFRAKNWKEVYDIIEQIGGIKNGFNS